MAARKYAFMILVVGTLANLSGNDGRRMRAPPSETQRNEADPYIDIFPPKHKPGDVISKTTQSDIDNALGEVLKAGKTFQSLRVAIGLAASTTALVNPTYYLKDGVVHSTLPPTIKAGQTGLMLFTKSSIGISGVWGVVTYDIEGTGVKVAVMFRIINDLFHAKVFNLKAYDQLVDVDKDLVKQMYSYAGPWSPGAYETREEYGVRLQGSMSDNKKSKLIAWVDAGAYDRAVGPNRFSECAYNSAKVGKRCWRECSPLGWCWTNVKCSKKLAVCTGDLPCSSRCR